MRLEYSTQLPSAENPEENEPFVVYEERETVKNYHALKSKFDCTMSLAESTFRDGISVWMVS